MYIYIYLADTMEMWIICERNGYDAEHVYVAYRLPSLNRSMLL